MGAYRLAESLTVFALASLDERLNPSEDTDLGTIDGQLGARYEFARSSLTGSFQGQRFEVDNNLFRSVTAATPSGRSRSTRAIESASSVSSRNSTTTPLHRTCATRS